MAVDLRDPGETFLAFWREYHVCTLTTPRPDGTPHVVAVGGTYAPEDGERGIARVIANRHSRKVANVLAAGPDGARAALCQVAGRHWATLEGVARIRAEPEEVAYAVERYTARYGRTPSPNPDRVVIEITLTRAMGRT
ncbi:pyridoxamine 5'-phosphate oxidase family protein [Streptomyces sp. NPDC046887]|uniref:pyridoxamine 5'-phosphate oxidase family protein n=1 Tax=Streptomyces sp. NPDC046887 TaxID=3155472 RepID=UPI0033CC5259